VHHGRKKPSTGKIAGIASTYILARSLPQPPRRPLLEGAPDRSGDRLSWLVFRSAASFKLSAQCLNIWKMGLLVLSHVGGLA
jgi:hypothetical protein